MLREVFFVFGKGKTEGAENSCVGSFGARPVTTRIPGCESWEEALASLREFEEQSLRMDLVSYNSATGIPMDSWDVKTRIWGKPQMGDWFDWSSWTRGLSGQIGTWTKQHRYMSPDISSVECLQWYCPRLGDVWSPVCECCGPIPDVASRVQTHLLTMISGS